jgi:formylglycine-generating enzyme required for sulfatase activity
LPTEAEWEYAAKGNAGYFDPANEVFDYAGSNQLDQVGWYDGNNYSETKPVGLLFPNQFGLYDLSGNVCEWCWDWYSDYDNRLNNPVGAESGSNRVLRGGSWIINAASSRSDCRNSDTPGSRNRILGLRLLFVP